jgi:asparagine synthase (glutamine-hydrolysing)
LSGIHGILKFGGNAVSRRDLERQSNALTHRGPDRRNFWHDGAVGMGHLLMRITAEDSFDAQPLRDRDAGLTLVADARLDNREELAGAMAIDAALLRELPDSALLLKAYRRWGADCVDHLIGDFVFAVWDAAEHKLVLGRDHMGQRHVLFHRGKNSFVFASEPKGLWAMPDVPHALSDLAMGRLFVLDLGRVEGETRFEEIFGLAGGTLMTVTAAGEIETRRYWTPRADPAHLNRDEAYYRHGDGEFFAVVEPRVGDQREAGVAIAQRLGVE